MASERSTMRYEAAIATFIGVLALMVSAYTAYMQRQQVRAQVWPILEYTTSNEPRLRLTVANKGVGPALIRHVIVTVDNEPLHRWSEVLLRLLGPGDYGFSESTLSDHILSAGETLDILTPHDVKGGPLAYDKKDSLGDRFNRGRSRIGVEICYCSTLGDCWILTDVPGKETSTVDTRRCPAPSERTFKQ